MATTYKEINSSTPVVLTAPVFADGIEVHANHPLRPCIRYQWFFDNLVPGNVPVHASGTSDQETYTVDLSSVANSGNYYCEISVGTTGDCDQRTEDRIISIVNCGNTTAAGSEYAHDGAVGNVTVEHAHFEGVSFSDEGLSWITLTDPPVACLSEPGACLSVATFSVAGNTGSEARRGQVSLTVGDIVCYYNVVQTYEGGVAPAVEPDPDFGPYINLSTDGPVLALILFGSGIPITVTADVGVIGGTLNNYTIAWSGTGVTGNGDTATVDNPGAPAQNIPVTATVTDTDTGLTATATIDAVFYLFQFPDETTTIGDLTGQVNWRVLQTLGAGGSPYGMHEVRGDFTVSGAGNWTVSLNWHNGFFGQPAREGSATLTISGPGAGLTFVVNPDNPSVEFEAEGLVGAYSWNLEIEDVEPDLSYANASMVIYPRLF